MPSTALLLHWSATREQQESSQQQDQPRRRSVHGPCMLVSDRLHVRGKSSETNDTCPGQLLILLVHHAHGFEPVGSCWSFLRNEVYKFTRRWELFSASRGRNMVSSIASGRQNGARHQDESLWALEERGFVMRQSPSTTRHFQAGKPSFSVTCLLIVYSITQLPFPRRPQYRDLVRMGVTLLSQCSRLFSQAQFGEQNPSGRYGTPPHV